MIEIGMSYTAEMTVGKEDTAKAVGSGELEVLATPKMCALMEESAYKCIGAELDEGASSVGTVLEIKHLSATPVGMSVKAIATVTEVDGRRIVFELKAYDDTGIIGEGRHERFIVYSEKFIAKAYSKLN